MPSGVDRSSQCLTDSGPAAHNCNMTQKAVAGGRWKRFRSKFVVEERYLPRSARARLYLTAAALVVIGLATFIVLLVAVLTHTGVERLDKPVEAWFDAQRNGATTGFMIVIAIVFGPVALPIIVTIITVAWVVAAK